MPLIKPFQQHITDTFPQSTDFCIALSGGLDSIVLLHLFKAIQTKRHLTLRAIHVHHGLSANADYWANFCQQVCNRLQIPLEIAYVQINKQQGIEAGARQARYNAFAERLQPHEILATAHHLDDQAETFFLALKRGCGVKGLGAMQAVTIRQNFTLFRPLLGFSRQQLADYANVNQLTWIEDESNRDTHYDRNFLRQIVLPELNKRWQGFSEMVTRSAKHCADQQRLIEELLNESLQRYTNVANRFNLIKMASFSRQKQHALLRLWLEKNELLMPTTAQLHQLIDQLIYAENDKNPQLKLGKHIIRRYQNHLYITPEFADTASFTILLHPQQQKVQLPDNIGEISRATHQITYKKGDKLDRFTLPETLAEQTLTLTLSATGKVKCFQQAQRVDIKKLWQKKGVPVWERTRTPLLFYQNELVLILNTHQDIHH